MGHRVGKIILSFSLVLFSLITQHQKIYASSSCTICILEFGAASEMGEGYDYVIIGNSTATSVSLSSVQLQYYNSLGVYDSKVNLSGTLAAGQAKIYTSTELKTYNPLSSILPFSIYSGGGSLVLEKVLTASTTVYDSVGWGEASLYEGDKIDSTSIAIFHRKLSGAGSLIDTGDNSQDFSAQTDSCNELTINEVQPFATDVNGAAVESWVELSYTGTLTNSCYIAASNNMYYEISPSTYPEDGGLLLINSIDTSGVNLLLELPNPSGSIAISTTSFYAFDRPVIIPSSEISYSDLLKSQSYGQFDIYGVPMFKATYQQTPGEDNLLQSEPVVVDPGDINACSNIVINEIMPNPLGSDTNLEWIEIFNNDSAPQDLRQCVLGVEAEKYYFLPGMMIGPYEYQKYDSLYSEDGLDKSISLRNTDETYISMSRLYAAILSNLQSFTYSDAPEGMSYSRFDEGWAWTYEITPEYKNVYKAEKPTPTITEARAVFKTVTSVAPVATTASKAKASTASKKSSSTNASSKSLAATAKSTTGAKTTESRDIYAEPDTTKSGTSSYVFVVIGVMAVIYALYEYKVDIQNFYIKRRGNKIFSSENRPAD